MSTKDKMGLRSSTSSLVVNPGGGQGSGEKFYGIRAKFDHKRKKLILSPITERPFINLDEGEQTSDEDVE